MLLSHRSNSESDTEGKTKTANNSLQTKTEDDESSKPTTANYWRPSHRLFFPNITSQASESEATESSSRSCATDEILLSACRAQLEKNKRKARNIDDLDEYLPRTKSIKNAGCSIHVKYSGRIGLINEKAKVTEFFKLYKDQDIGFDGFCQKLIKETVFFAYFINHQLHIEV